MTIRITTAHASLPLGERSVADAMRRGVATRCPACGKGRLYARFLKVASECSVCGTELHHHRADDAPPYFTMLIVGHLVVGGVLSLERFMAPPYWAHLVIWLPLTVALSLVLLPLVKGALIGLQWALGMHGFGSGPDPAEPDPLPAAETSYKDGGPRR